MMAVSDQNKKDKTFHAKAKLIASDKTVKPIYVAGLVYAKTATAATTELKSKLEDWVKTIPKSENITFDIKIMTVKTIRNDFTFIVK